jgi:hypothetical protein
MRDTTAGSGAADGLLPPESTQLSVVRPEDARTATAQGIAPEVLQGSS